MKKICQYCNKKFTKVSTDSKRYFTERRIYCSSACSSAARKGKSVSSATQFKKGDTAGAKNHAWKSGRHLTTNGYVAVLVGIKKYQLEHRVIMEAHIGRKLKSSEHVHHINHIKTDNRIENLRLLSAKDHGTMHANERWAR